MNGNLLVSLGKRTMKYIAKCSRLIILQEDTIE